MEQMTAEQAIQEIKYYMNHDSYVDAPSNEACRLAIDALEKQVAKKPIIDRETPWNTKIYRCQVCETFVEVYLPERYCAICGQALDWTE